MVVVIGRMGEGMSHLVLLAVPLFVFLGALIEMNGMARAMVRFLSSLIGHVRGGLSYVLLVAIYLVSGIAGSKAPHLREEHRRDRRHVGIILAMGIGLFAPPFGVGYYTACAISAVNPDEGMKPIAGYLVALTIGLIVVAAIPWFSIGFLAQ